MFIFFSYFSTKTNVVCTQKNRLNESSSFLLEAAHCNIIKIRQTEYSIPVCWQFGSYNELGHEKTNLRGLR